jgi:UDP-N-acetylglucosamine:LPS N-acetylglucosamine transferase
MSLDKDWTGQRFFDVVRELCGNRPQLEAMGDAARKLAHPGAARRAAEILVEVSGLRH